MTALTYAAALDEAMADAMRADDRVFLMATNPAARLRSEFGADRVREMPIAESAMTGMAIGAAASGLRPILHFSAVNFSFVAFDQMVNQAARIRYMFGGQREFPIVFRARYLNGTRSAAQHSQTGYAYYAHAGGIKLVVPSGAADAAVLFGAAIRDPNPVMIFEPDRLHPLVDDESVPPAGPAELGRALISRPGADVTVAAIGYMVKEALRAADALAEEGISAEVIDLRTVAPLDLPTIAESTSRTGRLVVVDESMPMCSIASEVITAVVESPDVFASLSAPPLRITTTPTPVPYSPPLEDYVLPGAAHIIEGVRRVVGTDVR